MKFLIKLAVVLGLLAAVGSVFRRLLFPGGRLATNPCFAREGRDRRHSNYRQCLRFRKAVIAVRIGEFVSGPIQICSWTSTMM